MTVVVPCVGVLSCCWRCVLEESWQPTEPRWQQAVVSTGNSFPGLVSSSLHPPAGMCPSPSQWSHCILFNALPVIILIVWQWDKNLKYFTKLQHGTHSSQVINFFIICFSLITRTQFLMTSLVKAIEAWSFRLSLVWGPRHTLLHADE